MKANVVTRFPPSPTGALHVGGARTALFNYLFTRQKNGMLLLRMEDTDTARSDITFEKDIIDGLAWLGINHNKDVIRQSERTELYQEHLHKLLDTKHAYEAEQSDKGRGNVIRFKNPNTIITFTDLVRGEVTFDTTDLGDFIIARDSTSPLYHLAVVVDDALTGVTHVIRGDDHISNTPRQILVLEALGFTRPTYAHIPLILAPDKSKLSKRHGALSVHQYREVGVLPEALMNYLALLGWHPSNEQELFTEKELIREFDLSRVQKSGAIFDKDKLRSINKKHLQNLSDEQFLTELKKQLRKPVLELWQAHAGRVKSLIPLLRERIEIFSDVNDMIGNNELEYFFETPTYQETELPWKKDSSETARTHLSWVRNTIADLNEKSFTKQGVKEAVWSYADEEGRGNVLWPTRYALSGKKQSADPFEIAAVLGKKETLARLDAAIKKLS